MSETDNPLKLLITEFAEAFAAWLLPQPIQWIRPLNVEFPATPLRSDLLFEVLDEDFLLRQGLPGLVWPVFHTVPHVLASHQPVCQRPLPCFSPGIVSWHTV